MRRLVMLELVVILLTAGHGHAQQAQSQDPAAGTVWTTWNYSTLTLSFPVNGSTALTVWNDTLHVNVPAVPNGPDFIAFNIPLATGLNRLRQVRTPHVGAARVSAERLISVNRIGEGVAAVFVTPSPAQSEALPAQVALNVSFDVAGEVPSEVWLDVNGDGVVDSTQPFSPSPIVSYAGLGRFNPLVTIKTQSGHLYTSLHELTAPVSVLPPTVFAPSPLPALPGPIVDSYFDPASRKLYSLSSTPDVLSILDMATATVQTYGPLGTNGPQGFGIDRNKNIYVADTGNNRIIKLLSASSYSPDTSISTTGAFGALGSADGEFNSPHDVLVVRVGPLDAVWVSDTSNHRIQRFTSQGVFKQAVDGTGTPSGPFVTPTSIYGTDNDSKLVWDSGTLKLRGLSAGGAEWASFASGALYASVSSIADEAALGGFLLLDDSSQSLSVVTSKGLPVRKLLGVPSGQRACFADAGPTSTRLYLVPSSGGALLVGDLVEDPPGQDPVSRAQLVLQALATHDASGLTSLCHKSLWLSLSSLLQDSTALASAGTSAQSTSQLVLIGSAGPNAEVAGVTTGQGYQTVIHMRRDDATGAWVCLSLPWISE